MNTIRFSLLSFLVFTPAAMMAQANDTLIVNNPDQVIISQSSDALAVKISGKDGNPDYRFSREVSLSNQSEVSTSQSINRRSPLSWDFKQIEKDDKTSLLELALFKDFSIGFLTPFDRPQEMADVKFFQSFEASLNMLSFIYYPGHYGHSRNWYSLEANLNYRHITMKGDMRFTTAQGGDMQLIPYPEGAKPENSMMQILKPELALNFYRSFHKDLSFGIGIGTMFGGYTNHCNTRSNYTDNEGNKIHEVNDVRDIFGFNLSVKAQLLLNGFGGLYIKYYPKSGFKSGHGPQFQSLSIGLTFRFGK
jgi:hypothetical protein